MNAREDREELIRYGDDLFAKEHYPPPWKTSPTHGKESNEIHKTFQDMIKHAISPQGYPKGVHDISACWSFKRFTKYHCDLSFTCIRAHLSMYKCRMCGFDTIIYDLICATSSDEDLLKECAIVTQYFPYISILADHLVHRGLHLPSPSPRRQTLRESLLCKRLFYYTLLSSSFCSTSVLQAFYDMGHPPLILPIPVRLSETPPSNLQWMIERYGVSNILIDNTTLLSIVSSIKPECICSVHLALLLDQGFSISDTCISILMKYYAFGNSPDSRSLQKSVTQLLQSRKNIFDPYIFCIQTGPGPNDTGMEIIVNTSDENSLHVFLYNLIGGGLDVGTILDVDYWILYLHKKKLLDQFSRRTIAVWKSYKQVDPRIVRFLYDSGTEQVNYPVQFPPFGLHGPMETLEYEIPDGTSMSVPVYIRFLVDKSEFFKGMYDNVGKFQTNVSSNCVRFQVPPEVKNISVCINNWITFCYTGMLPCTLSNQDIFDLYHLVSYLLDESCIFWVERRLEEIYMNTFEQHQSCSDDCLVCSVWDQSRTMVPAAN